MNISRKVLPASKVHSLTWCRDTLVDWVGGIQVFHLDGRYDKSRLFWGFDFDAAIATPNGRFAVIYKRLGTKALVLRDGKILRELNRSYYFAGDYEYPICIWNSMAGQTLIAHCPDDYCRIDIEDAETGERLTGGNRKPEDFFHSRLKVNSDGTRLLSAGWMWHPFDSVVYFDLAEALRNPAHLDGLQNFPQNPGDAYMAEAGTACWQSQAQILLGGVARQAFPESSGGMKDQDQFLRVNGLAIYDVTAKTYLKSFALEEPPGMIMPIAGTHAICFYRHPRLVALNTREVVHTWDDLETGNEIGSISSDAKAPPIALDPSNNRFAVSAAEGIHVIQVETDN